MKTLTVAISSIIALLVAAPLALAQDATVQSTCAITDITEGALSECNPDVGTYSKAVIIHYTAPPASGNLSVYATSDGVTVSASVSITSSPQTVMLNGLPVNGLPVEVTASFTAAPSCMFWKDPLFIAPADCNAGMECSIEIVESVGEPTCDPDTNTYEQCITLGYWNAPETGMLVVNGQEFAIGTSPQVVCLTGLPADGQPVDVTAFFTDNPDCRATRSALFTAPDGCTCAIDGIAVLGEPACDSDTNTYDLCLSVTYRNAPTTGMLVVNGQNFPVGTSPQQVCLTGLPADGQAVVFTASFTAEPECTFTSDGSFTAPANCRLCSVQAIDAVGDPVCDTNTNTYNQQVTVTFVNPPTSGKLVVNEQLFDIGMSPRQVMLTGLPADGQPVDVTAYFTADPGCTLTEQALFTAPTRCATEGQCAVTNIEVGPIVDCNDDDRTYSRQVIITYENEPSSGLITVVAWDGFPVVSVSEPITGSPQIVTLNGLPLNGHLVTVRVSFSADANCTEIAKDLFTSPMFCPPLDCVITTITAEGNSICDPSTSTYEQCVKVSYTDPPISGTLVVNGQDFPIGTSPQIVCLTGLEADGMPVDVTAHFSQEPRCTLTEEGLFIAPEPGCPPCDITDLEAIGDAQCDALGETYEQTVRVTYENDPGTGKLVVNGQEFDIETSPQDVTLMGLPADGQFVDVTAFFDARPDCNRTEMDLFKAPEPDCPPCAIIDLRAIGSSVCDPQTSTYSQRVEVTFANRPSSGELIVNGQPFAIGTSPQIVLLEGLTADGQPVDVSAFFSANTECSRTEMGLFTAPESDCPLCDITDLEAIGDATCNAAGTTYSQVVRVTYSNAPGTGMLVVNGQAFAITTSPQDVTLTDLPADGQFVDVTASFSDDPDCERTEMDLFKAPESDCPECDITDLEAVGDADCDPQTSTYSQQVRVTFVNRPSSGELIVNGQAFAIGTSPQTVLLDGLPADGQFVDVTAHFSANPECERTEMDLFKAPEQDCPPCAIEDLAAIGEADCDVGTATYSQQVEVTFSNRPSSGTLVVNGQEFEIGTSPQVVLLEGLPADGQFVDVTAFFSANPDCRLTADALFEAPEEDCGGLTHEFVLLGDEEVRVDSPKNSEGAIHSNNDMNFVTDNGNRGFHNGDLTAVDDIDIGGRNVVDGSAFAGDELEIGSRAEVTGEQLEGQAIDIVPIPEIPDFEPGDDDVRVADDKTKELQPGDYDEITVGEEATLVLFAGEYNVDEFWMERESVLQIELGTNESIVINVDSRLEFEDAVYMALSEAASTRHVLINYAGTEHAAVFGSGSVICGTVIAPDADVRLEEELFLKGAICAERIFVEEQVTFAPHNSNIDVPDEPILAGSPPTDTGNVAPPRAFRLAAHPNPFNPNTKISYAVPRSGPTSLVIYTANGRAVRQLFRGERAAGAYEIVWDGRDDRGIGVPSGHYYAVLRSHGEIKKSLGMVVLR